MAKYGYARVSTELQHLDRQLAAMKAEGIREENIFCDKVSGKNFNRESYLRLTGADGGEPVLREGDCLVVLSLDRLGRDYEGLREEWQRITQTLKSDIKVLDMPLLDTTNANGTLDKRFIADLVLQILSYTAAKERDNIRARIKGGIEVARARGAYTTHRKGGKPRKGVDSVLFEELYQQCQTGLTTQKQAAVELGLTPPVLSRRFADRAVVGEGYDPNKSLGQQTSNNEINRPA